MDPVRPDPLPSQARAMRFVAAVLVAGGACLLATALLGSIEPSGALLMFAALVVAGELLPIEVPGRDDSVTLSTSFVFAVLVVFGTLPAVLCLVVASALADLRTTRSTWRLLFNVAQYALCVAGAGVVLSLGGLPHASGDPLLQGDLPVLVLGGLVFFVLNDLLAGTATALATGTPVRDLLREDLRFQAASAAVLVAFTPVVVAVGADDVLLMPLLALPLLALFYGSRAARMSEHQALHDALTGLPNRALLGDRLGQALAAARRSGRTVAVLAMDLDRFKEINDTLGHRHGDRLMRAVATRLASAVRPSDTVARVGGDEFAVVARDLDGPEGGALVAERLRDALRDPFEVDGVALAVSATVGIACSPVHGADAETLLRRADVALGAAKADRSGHAVYAETADPHTVDRLTLVSDLRRALEGSELCLHFQPQVCATSGRLLGAEALMRWEHPTRGRVDPGVFVPIAERTGLIGALTAFALRSAVEQLAAWRAAGLGELVVAVNVSTRDVLDEGLPDRIAALLDDAAIPASALKLEITEGTVMSDPDRALAVLERLSTMGVGLAIDDFGTGYSSLSWLKRLPVDELKIDRSFVAAMDVDREDALIVASTSELARGLGLRTVAEGVETAAALDLVRRLGCDSAQGYFLCRPVPPEELERWARERAAAPAAAPSVAR